MKETMRNKKNRALLIMILALILAVFCVVLLIFHMIASNGQMKEAKENYASVTSPGHTAADCIGCKQCENACPQHLPITNNLKKAAEMFKETGE